MTGVPNADTVATTLGPVRGIELEAGIRRYAGIPYARAPFGEHRFEAPTPPEPWTDPLAADEFGPTAPKPLAAAGGLPDVPEPVIEGESCLNLNVWTGAPRPQDAASPAAASPADAAPAALRPVLVWIHGGGFFAGCSANPWYDGTAFALDGLVFVSLNYRLGAEGFADIPGAPRNRGVLDWIAGLEWVRDNIAAFGGDPDDVTVFGQSAGGMAVMTLLGIPSVVGSLFQRAIICSGVSEHVALTTNEAVRNTEALAAQLGIPATREAFAGVDPAALVDAQEIVTASRPGLTVEALASGSALLTWAPEVDGELVTSDPLDAVRAGAGADIPVLIGTTRDEFAFAYWLQDLSDPRGPEAVDLMFRRPTQSFVDSRAGAAPTHRYEFQWESVAYGSAVKSGHSLDICFFFGNRNAPYFERYSGRPGDEGLTEFEHGRFAQFALTGDPGWPAYSVDQSVQIFDTPARVETGFVAR